MDTKTPLILHGHFYQPPRENPSTGIIEKQPSAAPYSDWNEKIFHDCYASNASSRYLNSNGQVVSLTNNYSYISFNFGHTLLSWMKEYHPLTHELIVEADKESIRRLGHGNAIAQGFNHTILPLDKVENARLQVVWGIKDFVYRFNREPEGMWLPEAAINNDVIDILAEEGIKFVILSPWQCKSIEGDDGKMIELGSSPAPCSTPYILTGTKGKTIAAFFYHPGLAEGISFGHALRNADQLYDNLLSIRSSNPSALIHTATDGEIYGHHEPFGDMALAALIKKVGERNDFEFTNYATFLSQHEATKHAILHRGEEGKGTSWSCSHGVSRWYKDCGCHTGGEEGWNQAWRTPLRNSLNRLCDSLTEIFNKEVQRIFNSQLEPYALLLKAGDTFSGRLSMKEFLTALHSDYKFSRDDDSQLAQILTGMKNIFFAFTSCGFFFSDISGLEPRQNIKYALYAIRMLQSAASEDLLLPFLSDLKEAKSNIKSQGTGMKIAQEEMKWLNGEIEAALFFHMNRSTACKEDYLSHYGRFNLLDCSTFHLGENFTAEVEDTISLRKFKYTILSSSSAEMEEGLTLYISENDEKSNHLSHFRSTRENLPDRMLDDANRWIEHALFMLTPSQVKSTAASLRIYAMLAKSFRSRPMKTQMLENLGIAVKLMRTIFIQMGGAIDWPEKDDCIHYLVWFILNQGSHEEYKALQAIINEHADTLAKEIREQGLNDSIADKIKEVVKICAEGGLHPDLTELQNAVYPYYTGKSICELEEDEATSLFTSLNFQE